MTLDKTKGHKAYFLNEFGVATLIAQDSSWTSTAFPAIKEVKLLTDFIGYMDNVRVCKKAFDIPLNPDEMIGDPSCFLDIRGRTTDLEKDFFFKNYGTQKKVNFTV